MEAGRLIDKAERVRVRVRRMLAGLVSAQRGTAWSSVSSEASVCGGGGGPVRMWFREQTLGRSPLPHDMTAAVHFGRVGCAG
jgi:hypothetical protein